MKPETHKKLDALFADPNPDQATMESAYRALLADPEQSEDADDVQLMEFDAVRLDDAKGIEELLAELPPGHLDGVRPHLTILRDRGYGSYLGRSYDYKNRRSFWIGSYRGFVKCVIVVGVSPLTDALVEVRFKKLEPMTLDSATLARLLADVRGGTVELIRERN